MLMEINIPAGTQPGVVPIVISDNKRNTQTLNLSLYQRQHLNNQPLTPGDAIYDILIDRFVNGNSSNDKPSGYLEPVDRTNPSGIHGGDLAGIIAKYDYIKNMGFTAIKLSPLAETNQTRSSYQTDAPTNFYALDQRLGTISELNNLRGLCKTGGTKFIQSFVLHQAGINNPIASNPPFSTWLMPDAKNYETTITATPAIDPHSSLYDSNNRMRKWDSPSTPRLNQQDKFLNTYLMQSLIWWIETTQPDAIEIKQAWKNDRRFLDYIFDTLSQLYPSLQIIPDVPFNRESHLMAWINQFKKYPNLIIRDYPLSYTVADAFSSFTLGSDGSSNLYNIIASDNMYPDASNNIISADNVQMNRAWNNADKDPATIKLMLTYLLTTRGIPLMHYGTEALIDGISKQNEHLFYKDFPGGWNNDQYDFFNPRNHSQTQIQAVQLITRLLQWRQENKNLLSTPLIHFSPRKGQYAYYRTLNNHTMMVIINNNKESVRVDFNDYPEILGMYENATDIVTNEKFGSTGSILLQGKNCVILEMKQLKDVSQE
jgi:glycosidase